MALVIKIKIIKPQTIRECTIDKVNQRKTIHPTLMLFMKTTLHE